MSPLRVVSMVLSVMLLVVVSSGIKIVSAQDEGGWQVAEVHELELMAGPANQAAYLAPDGEHFAYHTRRRELCVYTIAGDEQHCVDLQENRAPLDAENPAWSPDSSMIAFNNEFLTTFWDPDIWTLDAATGELTNHTDDERDDIGILRDDPWPPVDNAPAWLPDSSGLLFLRYQDNIEGEVRPWPHIMSLDLSSDAGEPDDLGGIPTDDPFPVFVLAVSPDGERIAYNVYGGDATDPTSGLWISDLDGGNAQQLEATTSILSPFGIAFSPDGRYVLSIANRPFDRSGAAPSEPIVKVVDLETGDVLAVDEGRFVTAAGWSPDGSTLAYLVSDMENEDNAGLYITDTPGEPGTQVLQGHYLAPTPRQRRPLTWGANNTLLLTSRGEFNLIAVELTQE